MIASDAQSLIWWDWVDRHRDEIVDLLLQHLWYTVFAVGVGLVISVVLAAISIRWRPLYTPIAWITGALYAVPSIALFGLLVPVLGLGFAPAQVALVSYTLLILLRNLVEAHDGIPDDITEAADAMGYTRRQRLLSVQLPLAVSPIIAGLRIATVSIVGLITVAAMVGAGGLGVYILDGLDREFPTPIVVGAGLSIGLALAFDLLFVGLERVLTPWSRVSRGG
ncbi:MAG: ABC transporter permease [Acidimicrobiales bacterium]